MHTNTNESLPGVNVNSMTLSDSAVARFQKKASQLNVYDGAVVYCKIYQKYPVIS